MPEGCKSFALLPGQQCSLHLLWIIEQQQRRRSVNSLSWLPVPVPNWGCVSLQSRWCTWGFAEPELPPSTACALPSTHEAVTFFRIVSFLQQTYTPDGRRSSCPKGHDAALLATLAGGGAQTLLFALWGLEDVSNDLFMFLGDQRRLIWLLKFYRSHKQAHGESACCSGCEWGNSDSVSLARFTMWWAETWEK